MRGLFCCPVWLLIVRSQWSHEFSSQLSEFVYQFRTRIASWLEWLFRYQMLNIFVLFQRCFILLRPSTIRTRGRLRHSRSFSSPQRILHTPEKEDDDDDGDDHKMIKNMIKMMIRRCRKKVVCSTLQTKQATCQLWSRAFIALSVIGLLVLLLLSLSVIRLVKNSMNFLEGWMNEKIIFSVCTYSM